VDVNDWWVPWVLALGPMLAAVGVYVFAYLVLRNHPERRKTMGLWFICFLPLLVMLSLGVLVVVSA
jgi:hypothetical protein